jgi:endonuclease YncB( thermonuclease family)
LTLTTTNAGSVSRSFQLDSTTVVYDGDTISFGKNRVRLDGIDAPELKQTCRKASGEVYPCGKLAQKALAALIFGHELLNCQMKATKKGKLYLTYGRPIATCTTPDGVNINREMVRSGHATAYVRYGTPYLAEQSEALAAKRGIWQGKFKMPSCERHAKSCEITPTK